MTSFTILCADQDIDVNNQSNQSTASLSIEDVRDADVVIVSEPQLPYMNYESLLYGNPRLRLVSVSGDGRHFSLYELRPCRIPLGELSPQTLLDAVRAQQAHGSTL